MDLVAWSSPFAASPQLPSVSDSAAALSCCLYSRHASMIGNLDDLGAQYTPVLEQITMPTIWTDLLDVLFLEGGLHDGAVEVVVEAVADAEDGVQGPVVGGAVGFPVVAVGQ